MFHARLYPRLSRHAGNRRHDTCAQNQSGNHLRLHWRKAQNYERLPLHNYSLQKSRFFYQHAQSPRHGRHYRLFVHAQPYAYKQFVFKTCARPLSHHTFFAARIAAHAFYCDCSQIDFKRTDILRTQAGRKKRRGNKMLEISFNVREFSRNARKNSCNQSGDEKRMGRKPQIRKRPARNAVRNVFAQNKSR